MLLLALLSATLFGDAQRVSCEMHGLGAARSGRMHAGHDGHATPSAASHAHGGTHTPVHPGCDCSCIGDCTTVAPLAIAPSTAIILVAVVAPAPRRALDREPAQAPPTDPERLLPFANGPPAAALS